MEKIEPMVMGESERTETDRLGLVGLTRLINPAWKPQQADSWGEKCVSSHSSTLPESLNRRIGAVAQQALLVIDVFPFVFLDNLLISLRLAPVVHDGVAVGLGGLAAGFVGRILALLGILRAEAADDAVELLVERVGYQDDDGQRGDEYQQDKLEEEHGCSGLVGGCGRFLRQY